jgi:predicted phage terminase large subunit-like protein
MHCYWLMEVARKRLEYPFLKAFVPEHAQKHRPDKILIEDTGTGSALIQELRFTPYNVVGVRPVNDKLTRAQIVAAKFASGKVFLPLSAPFDFQAADGHLNSSPASETRARRWRSPNTTI